MGKGLRFLLGLIFVWILIDDKYLIVIFMIFKVEGLLMIGFLN